MALVPVDNEKYEVLEVIGRGAFGIIRKVRRKDDGQILCRKEINYLKMSQKERDQLQAEFNILSSLKHPNIVGYYHREHIRQSQELYMYMEYCGGGDLGTVIQELKQKDKLAKEDFVWRILSQLLTALYRCHYGIDPAEPGDTMRPKETRLRAGNTNPMILHRDLKPENIFLDGDKSVKLGDFGLSKIMQSHDFASTYVGTPFYMSPEICGAEKYTLKSDIWAVGCIIYELCTKDPPFNAQTHLQLINKIRKGEIAPLPREYSKELTALVKSCLSTNPSLRPDTETLLNHPFVWMARKQQEHVRLNRDLSTDKDQLERRARRAEEQLALLENERVSIRVDLEAQIRREWEVKARLEIDRQVERECQKRLERLQLQFDEEVRKRVQDAMSKHVCTAALSETTTAPTSAASSVKDFYSHHSSVTTAGESEWTCSTDLTELSDLSIRSPTESASQKSLPKKTKTPFTRSKTTLESPADVHMADPSPMSINSLNLSPRRTAANANLLSGKNLFSKIANNKARLRGIGDFDEDKENRLVDSDCGSDDNDEEDDDDDDDIPELPSPTRPKLQNTDPFKMPALPVNPLPSKARPGMQRQHTIATSTTNRMAQRPTLFPTTGRSAAAAQVRASITTATQQNQPTTVTSSASNVNLAQPQSQIPRSATDGDVRPKSSSPTHGQRRLSKIPSRQELNIDGAGLMGPVSTSPLRRAATTTDRTNNTFTNGTVAGSGSCKLQSKQQLTRTDAKGLQINSNGHPNTVAGRTKVELAHARAGGRPASADYCNNLNTIVTGPGVHQLPAPRVNGRGGFGLVDKDLPPVPVWDPDVLGDEAMPSPFLKRDTRTIRVLR